MVFPFLGKIHCFFVFVFCFVFFLTLTRLLSLRSGEVERTPGLIYPRVLLNSYSYMRERDYDGDFLEPRAQETWPGYSSHGARLRTIIQCNSVRRLLAVYQLPAEIDKNRRQVLYVRWTFRLIIGWGSYQFEKNNVHLIKMQSVWRACPVRVSLLFLVCFFCGLRKKLFGRKKKAPFRNKTTKSHCMLNIPFV